MLHDWAWGLWASGQPSAGVDHTIAATLITVGGSVVIGIMTLIGTAMTRAGAKPDAPVPAPPPPVPLSTVNIGSEDDELRKRNEALETFLWRHQMDPNRIDSGTEPMSEVRFNAD